MMKHRFLYLLLLPLLLAGCSKLEKDGLYYYYFSDKIYLSERRDLLYIEFTDGLSEAEKQAIVQSDPFAVSDHFSVQLGVGTTRAQLEALANRYGCTVRLWEGFSDRDDIYIVTVPKSVSMGVVRLSAVFQETHLFGWTSPDFVIFGAFDA